MSVCCSLVHVKRPAEPPQFKMKADYNREGGGRSVRVSQIKVFVCLCVVSYALED